MNAFDAAFDKLMAHEGGYVNHPNDPGGETMWGVTQRVAVAHGYSGPMRDLPKEKAKDICRRSYWAPLRLDELDPRVAFQILDANYNGGPVIIWMQQASGSKATGVFNQAVIDAVRATAPQVFIARFNAYRLLYFTACKPWPTFGKGWARRVAHNLLIP